MSTLYKRPRDDFFGLSSVFREFDDLMSSFDSWASKFDYGQLSSMVSEKVIEDGEHTLSLSVPGFSKSDLKVTVSNGVLCVTGKNKERTVSYSETISPAIDPSTIEAECKDGILSIKMKEKVTPVTEIEVK